MAYNGIVLFDDVKYNYLVVKKGSATQEELTNLIMFLNGKKFQELWF